MDKNDMPRFGELMAWLAQTYNNHISHIDVENYWRFFKSYPLRSVEQAIINYCRSPDGHAFMPKPGEIISYIEGSSFSQATQAWTKVMKAVKRLGVYTTVVFDDPLIHAVLYDMGGWIKLCEAKEKDTPFVAREFEKRYGYYLMNNPLTYPKQFTGLFDAQNTRDGYKADLPMLIGNENVALDVYKNGQEVEHLNQSYKKLSLDRLAITKQSESEKE
jgi:hypothetical protein